MFKFFRVPFAQSGDKTDIPDAVDPSGNVSFTQGYGFDYQRPKIDPLAKNIERDKMNSLFNQITQELGLLQSQGVPDFITAALNDGVAYSYELNAIVRYTDDKIYRSIVAANTELPTNPAAWVEQPTIVSATDLIKGIIEIATAAETQTGTDATRAVTPAGLASVTATETRAGLIEIATAAEAQAFTANKAIDGAKLASAFQGANQNLATNGFQKLPGGLILQWAAFGTTGSETVSFPFAFPNACFGVGIMRTSSGGSNIEYAQIISFIAASFGLVYYPNVSVNTPGAGTITYLAIGW